MERKPGKLGSCLIRFSGQFSNISFLNDTVKTYIHKTKVKIKKITLQEELVHVSQVQRLKLGELQFSHLKGGEHSVFGEGRLDAHLMKPRRYSTVDPISLNYKSKSLHFVMECTTGVTDLRAAVIMR